MSRSAKLTIVAVIFAVIMASLAGAYALKNEHTLQQVITAAGSSELSVPQSSSSSETSQVQTSTASTSAKQTTAAETAPGTTAPAVNLNNLSVIDLYPLSLSGGDWDVKHCQGIAVDAEHGFIYYSYTTLLVKCSFDGEIVATVSGIKGHLGDITYNAADRKIYCGYNAPNKTGFYVVIFDTTKIKKIGTKPTEDVVRSVYVKEAYEDYKYNKVIEKDDGSKITLNHRYGCSGIDGVTMGPDFSGKVKNRELLTVAYGIFSDKNRNDNNYQVLLQYDVKDWWSKYGQNVGKASHRSGPENCSKYFLYTGNTNYGTQTMEYFDELNIWVLNCYQTKKSEYNPYTLFAIDGDIAPKKQKLKGQPETDSQLVLSLYTDGHHDKKHEIWGWYSTYGTQGVAYISDGLFYVCCPYETWTGKKLAISYLNVWKSNKNGKGPFTLSVNVPNDYTIKKAKHVTTTTTTKPTTTAAASTQKNIFERIADIIN